MNGLKRAGAVLGLSVLMMVVFITPALAHKVRVFAMVEGDLIKGYGYFSKSSRAQNCPVDFFGPKGEKMGRATTDQQGNFSFKPKIKCDHRLVLNAGEGHQGEFLIQAAELPDSLAPYQTQAGSPAPVRKTQNDQPPSPAVQPGKSLDLKELDRIVSAAVAKQMAPLNKQIIALREQLNEYGDKVRWHDVLGGIGFIVGFAGIWLLVAGRRRGGKG